MRRRGDRVEATRRWPSVEAVGEAGAGAPDDNVLAHAAGSGMILLTADKDFGELVYRTARVLRWQH